MSLLGAAALAGGATLLSSGLNAWSSYNASNKTLDYTKWAQEQTWNREDTAYQRAVADAKKAGLSPLSVSAAATSTPQSVNYPAVDYSGVGDAVNAALNTYQKGKMLENQMTVSNAQATAAQAQARLATAQADQSEWNLRYYKGKNIPTDYPDGLLVGNEILKALGNLTSGKAVAGESGLTGNAATVLKNIIGSPGIASILNSFSGANGGTTTSAPKTADAQTAYEKAMNTYENKVGFWRKAYDDFISLPLSQRKKLYGYYTELGFEKAHPYPVKPNKRDFF